MSCDIDSDSFHGTKKGGRRLTAIPAYQGDKRVKSAIQLLMANIVRLRKRNMVSQSEYMTIVNALGDYAEHYKK
tara:strand:+ start:190 stop:411 length:222 start_codon:yes stop_codon:yes gene_type:complete